MTKEKRLYKRQKNEKTQSVFTPQSPEEAQKLLDEAHKENPLSLPPYSSPKKPATLEEMDEEKDEILFENFYNSSLLSISKNDDHPVAKIFFLKQWKNYQKGEKEYFNSFPEILNLLNKPNLDPSDYQTAYEKWYEILLEENNLEVTTKNPLWGRISFYQLKKERHHSPLLKKILVYLIYQGKPEYFEKDTITTAEKETLEDKMAINEAFLSLWRPSFSHMSEEEKNKIRFFILSAECHGISSYFAHLNSDHSQHISEVTHLMQQAEQDLSLKGTFDKLSKAYTLWQRGIMEDSTLVPKMKSHENWQKVVQYASQKKQPLSPKDRPLLIKAQSAFPQGKKHVTLKEDQYVVQNREKKSIIALNPVFLAQWNKKMLEKGISIVAKGLKHGLSFIFDIKGNPFYFIDQS